MSTEGYNIKGKKTTTAKGLLQDQHWWTFSLPETIIDIFFSMGFASGTLHLTSSDVYKHNIIMNW